MERLKQRIRHVPDFPKPGILFYDITTLLRDKSGFARVMGILYGLFFGGLGVMGILGTASAGSSLDELGVPAAGPAIGSTTEQAAQSADRVGQDEEISPRIERLPGPEELARELRREERGARAVGAVEHEHRLLDEGQLSAEVGHVEHSGYAVPDKGMHAEGVVGVAGEELARRQREVHP